MLAAVVALGGWVLARCTVEPPANDSPPRHGETGQATSAFPDESEVERRRRRWGFAVVASGFATTGAIGTALSFHQVAVLGERGLTPTAAATNFLPQSLAAATTAIAVGRLVDRLPGRVVIPLNMALLVSGLATPWLVRSPVTAVAFGVVIGGAVASNSASEGTLLARWAGTASLGRVRGRLMAIVVTSTAVAPLAFTLLVDAVGSFTRAATVAMALPVIVAVVALRAPLPSDTPVAAPA